MSTPQPLLSALGSTLGVRAAGVFGTDGEVFAGESVEHGASPFTPALAARLALIAEVFEAHGEACEEMQAIHENSRILVRFGAGRHLAVLGTAEASFDNLRIVAKLLDRRGFGGAKA
jgi:predicted regulator of Ras-like GTPase activity (Roadblock/LC7/MglB family)